MDSPFITLTQELGHYNAPYFDATDPEDRDNQQFTGSISWFLSGGRTGSHDVKAGLEHFTATNRGGNSQSPTGYVFDADYLTDDAGNPVYDAGRFVPVFVPGDTYFENWLPVRGATIDIKTMSLYAQDRWTPRKQLALDLGIRYERVRSDATGGIVGVNTDTVVPRLATTYDVNGDGRYIAQVSYAHYAGKYSEAQFAGNTNVGNPSRVFAFYTGPAGQGLDFAPGFDLANYQTFLGIFPTANVFFDEGLSAPVTREFTASLGTELGRGYVKGTYVWRNTTNFVEDFVNLENGVTDVVFEGADFRIGRLSSFQRHKARIWTTYSAGLGRFGAVDTGLAYRYDSALSYSLIAQGLALTDTQAALLSDYASTTSAQTIFFGRRGSELFPNGSHLFDLAVTYSVPLLRTCRPYVKLDMRNIFDSTPLIAHDTTLIANEDGPLDALGLPTTYTRGPRFGEATSNTDYPFPREFRVSFGFRF